MKKAIYVILLLCLGGCEGASLATHGATWGLSQYLGYSRHAELANQGKRIEVKIDAILEDRGIDTGPIMAALATGKKPEEPETPVLPWAGIGVGSFAVLAGLLKKAWPYIQKGAEKYVEKEIG